MTPLQKTLVHLDSRELAFSLGESLAKIEAILLELKKRGEINPKATFKLPVHVPAGFPQPQFEYIFQPI